MKIVQWNANQFVNQKNYSTPTFVADEIKGEKPTDIFIIVEIFKNYITKEFKDSLKDYKLYFSPGSMNTTNEDKGILIGVLEDSIPSNPSKTTMTGVLNAPNFLQVEIVYEGIPINIIGTRIRETDHENRKKQLDILLNYVTNENTIIMGDFNNARIRGDLDSDYTSELKSKYGKHKDAKKYNYHMIKDELNKKGFILHTPKGGNDVYSKVIGNFTYKLDHIATNNTMVMKSVAYDETFKERNKSNYLKWKKGYPDHSMLIAEIEFIKKEQDNHTDGISADSY